MNGFRIKSKSNGLDLYTHSEAVKDTAFIFNVKGNFNLDRETIYWMCIMHDLGKANPLFQSNMENRDFTKVCRHEISSILFIDILPNHVDKQTIACSILSHHKSMTEDDRSIHELFRNDEFNLYKNHIGKINEWGLTVKNYLLYHYGINCEIPSKEENKL